MRLAYSSLLRFRNGAWCATGSAAAKSGWQTSVIINAIGALLTAIVFLVIIATRFVHGAWAVLVLIPILVLIFRMIRQHYVDIAHQLSLAEAKPIGAIKRHTALVLVSGIHRGVIPALEFARSIAPDNTTALYVELDPEEFAEGAHQMGAMGLWRAARSAAFALSQPGTADYALC